MPGSDFRSRLSRMSIGARMALLTGIVVIAGFLLLAWGLSARIEQMLRQQQKTAMQAQTERVSEMIALFDHSLQQQTRHFLKLFTGQQLKPPYTLDDASGMEVKGRAAPTLADSRGVLTLDTQRLDDFSDMAGAPVTIFARTGDDFLRVATSLKDQQGARAMGTLLDRHSRSYAQLMDGKPYSGLANLFGIPYITRYEPMFDERGRVIGATFIGVDIRNELNDLKDRIRQLKVGDEGNFMIVNAAAGEHQGEVIAGGEHEGQSLLEQHDRNGEAIWPAMFKTASGTLHYSLAGQGGEGERTTYFQAYPEWQWIIAATAHDNEIDAAISEMRWQLMLAALVMALLIAGGLYWLMRRLISQPLRSVVELASQIAEGDLRHRLSSRRQDEIGQLIIAMNGIGDGLDRIVGEVRHVAGDIHASSHSLSSGNTDLSRRTESQAASLEETAASIEELSATVRQNTEHTRQGRERTEDMTRMAEETRTQVSHTEHSMNSLNDNAEKIRDIVGVIDTIAFQTNLLALNASVEAARAGEHGRGFAVVAEEVRRLASRSAEAASDIQRLIGDAVNGIRLSNEEVQTMGTRMGEFMGRVEAVSRLVRDISQASDEQLAGIEQINTAVAELDDVTQNNAALVEASSQTTRQLDQQSRSLLKSIDMFRQRETRGDERVAED
ncbi:methyl-accepting chemotaxis protein-2 (aspartate sensor receptor) [Kushneria sinocarnis]|uniref:Methyl-accepting chemotaxis protein-2 (Aspartate sensor receptor) n=1 Tax=Kushneria sinocarnis TaxID=595502 RepID=A0A420WTQ3_9GAMM|nr:Cache 3/Cache 2 fusion domain-containing protein [Kushneria sinocarnis]RKQ96340.1 methyl-accepting chemotaxis protein-2 (aspartate sensor receptor) [Kushneria sinocarnis]